jgi:hypothetical protein
LSKVYCHLASLMQDQRPQLSEDWVKNIRYVPFD